MPDFGAKEVQAVVQGHLVGNSDAVRAGFRLVERLAGEWDAEGEASTLAEVIAGWGDELALFRGG